LLAFRARDSLDPMARVAELAQALSCHASVVDILLASVSRVLSNPNDERVRKVSLKAKVFDRCEHVKRLMVAFLNAIGFEYVHGYLVLQTLDVKKLQAGHAHLEAAKLTDAYRNARDEELAAKAMMRTREAALAQESETRQAYLSKAPKEPQEGAAGSTQLCFLVQSPSSKARRFVGKRRFESWDTLGDVVNFARSLPGVPLDSSLELDNVTISPSMCLDLGEQRTHTLERLDLWPSGLILIRGVA